MFRQMRRNKQQLSEMRALETLDAATSGVLSLIGDEGYPYGVPLSFVRDGNTLYFHSAKSGHKIDAIRTCDKASFTVIAQDEIVADEFTTYFCSVIAFGKVSIVEDAQEKRRSADLLGRRYNPTDVGKDENCSASGFEHMHMIKLEMEHITGKEAIELVQAHS